MVTDKYEMKERIYALTQELEHEKDAKRRAQLELERSVFACMYMGKKKTN